jgi:hypothetical protein
MLIMDYARPGGVGWGVDWTSPGWDCSGKLILERNVLPAAATALF